MGARPHYPNITNDDPVDGDTLTWDASAGQWKSAAPSGSGGGASNPPGQAAHYIGTWDVAVAYAAGDCVRQWDGAAFKLYQAKKATTGDDPTSVVASWAEVTMPIVMWGGALPVLTNSGDETEPGIPAPDSSSYLQRVTTPAAHGALWVMDSGFTANWNLSGGTIDWVTDDADTDVLPLRAGRHVERHGRGGAVGRDDFVVVTDDDSVGLIAGTTGVRDGAGSGNSEIDGSSIRTGAGNGDAYAITPYAERSGSGAGDAYVNAYATVNDTATGTAFAGDTAIHHTGGEAHVLPTANAAGAWIDTQGPIDLLEVGGEPANPAVNIGRLFAIDDGAGHTQLVVKFNDGGRVVLATDGGTLGPVAQGAQKTFDQTANAVTATAVPAALGAFSGTLLSDVLTAIPTLIDGVNTNRKLINSLIDVLQEIKAAQ